MTEPNLPPSQNGGALPSPDDERALLDLLRSGAAERREALSKAGSEAAQDAADLASMLRHMKEHPASSTEPAGDDRTVVVTRTPSLLHGPLVRVAAAILLAIGVWAFWPRGDAVPPGGDSGPVLHPDSAEDIELVQTGGPDRPFVWRLSEEFRSTAPSTLKFRLQVRDDAAGGAITSSPRVGPEPLVWDRPLPERFHWCVQAVDADGTVLARSKWTAAGGASGDGGGD